jgi:tetratricopeptide (TPR) repeat protein
MGDTMKIGVLRSRLPMSSSMTDRQLNRLIVAVLMVLLIGAPTIAIVYFLDRQTESGTTLVERRVGELETAVRNSPNSIALRLQLAGAYGAAERYSDALKQLNAVLEVQPDNKTALVTRGDLNVALGQLDDAAADYTKVISIAGGGEFAGVDTELQQAYYDLGSLQLQQGKAGEAAGNLEAALAIVTTDADTLNLLGRAYLATGEPSRAVDALRKAVLFVPVGWSDPYETLRQAYTSLGNSDEADWAGAMAAFAANQPREARDALAALTDGDAALDAWVGLGLIDERLGDSAAALADYDHALAIDPQNFTALSGQSRLATPAGDGSSGSGS